MSSYGKLFAAVAAASLLIATMLGAYASHGLTAMEPRALGTVQTAVAFQFYHGLGLLAVALLQGRAASRTLQAAGWMFVAGTVLFCGGIYVSSLLGSSAASAVTPFGGSAFIIGWLLLLTAVLRSPSVGSS
jgi:uncharacterized membrane protein YgdD (TMEM256/DUF423 family)